MSRTIPRAFISISLESLFFHSVRMKWKPCSQRKHAERKRLLKERENLLRNLRRKEIRSVQRSSFTILNNRFRRLQLSGIYGYGADTKLFSGCTWG